MNAKTGEPVEKFKITPITYSSMASSARGIAQSNHAQNFDGSEFSFDSAFSSDSKYVAFRVEAIGFEHLTTRRYSYDSPSKAKSIRLQPTRITSVRVVDQSGNPVESARSWMVLPQDSLIISRFESYLMDVDGVPQKSDADGMLVFGTPVTRHAIIVATQQGYAEQYLSPGDNPEEMELQPWSSLHGRLYQDGVPVSNATIIARPIRELGGDNPHVQDEFQTQTDVAGEFHFERLPPVPTAVSSVLSSWRDYPITSNKSVPVDLKPGQYHEVDLGGSGLKVTGSVKLVGDDADGIEYRYGLNYLVAASPSGVPIPRHVKRRRFEVGEQFEYDKKLWGEAGRHGRISYFVKLNPDGSFLINGVDPGPHRFLIKLYEPPKGCLVDPVGYKYVEFNTNAYDARDGHIDLGELEVKLKTFPKVGDVFDNLRYTSIVDGQPSYLSKHRGTYLLVDFWATWCQPCIQSIPDLQALNEQVLDIDNAKLLSLSLDKDAEAVKDLVKQKSLGWEQGLIGDIQSTRAGAALGISSVPLYLVLDPAGKILARTYNLEEASKTLLQATKAD